jgi:hypothetical protein
MRLVVLFDTARWARRATFVSLHDAAARLYEETKAADVILSDTGIASRLSNCFDYHARQLIRYAQHGKATLYGRREALSAVMEPISRNVLWSGQCRDDMSSWIAENGLAFSELSLRDNDLRLVKQSMKGHRALREWCRRHAGREGIRGIRPIAPDQLADTAPSSDHSPESYRTGQAV